MSGPEKKNIFLTRWGLFMFVIVALVFVYIFATK